MQLKVQKQQEVLLKYADKRNARLAVIIGEDEIASNSVTIKDLFVGKEFSDKISDNKEWRSGKDSQNTCRVVFMDAFHSK